MFAQPWCSGIISARKLRAMTVQQSSCWYDVCVWFYENVSWFENWYRIHKCDTIILFLWIYRRRLHIIGVCCNFTEYRIALQSRKRCMTESNKSFYLIARAEASRVMIVFCVIFPLSVPQHLKCGHCHNALEQSSGLK